MSVPPPPLDRRGFIDINQTTTGYSCNSFRVLSNPNSMNFGQFQPTYDHQGNSSLRDYEDLVRRNYSVEILDCPPPPLGENSALLYSNSCLLQRGFHQLFNQNAVENVCTTPEFYPEYSSLDCQGQSGNFSDGFDERTSTDNTLDYPPYKRAKIKDPPEASLLPDVHFEDYLRDDAFLYEDSGVKLCQPEVPLSTNENMKVDKLEDSYLSNEASIFEDSDMKLYAEILNSKEDPVSSGLTSLSYHSCLSERLSISGEDAYDNLFNLSAEYPLSLREALEPGFVCNFPVLELNEQKKEDLRSGIQVKGVSFADYFTAKELKDHLSSFDVVKPCQGLNGLTIQPDRENSCQLCSMATLTFPPTPIYCAYCSSRIKPKMIYYKTPEESGNSKYRFCNKCFHQIAGSIVSLPLYGFSIPKLKLEKGPKPENTEEAWVQCDKCKLWQHQICALYNKKLDLEEKEKYVCPKCCLEEIELGQRVPLRKGEGLEAKNLPRTSLSDHLEERLSTLLKKEREKSANALGKNPAEVPCAEGLVVRVVSSIRKKLKVNGQFLSILNGKNYPAEHEYTSKVILLFQKIDGVDVCIFGMYAQEYGSECENPNKRCVYISYIDSVKYFRPQIQTVSGEALRTLVYHEILIGYLDYSKKRGFATCYIWACPPKKNEDYILYCHPDIQRTPKSEKLRSWYKSMLRKATEEKIVMDYTNMYELFFIPTKFQPKITAARLPYFEGDFWSTSAEDLAVKFEREASKAGENHIKSLEKRLCPRMIKSMGHTNISESGKDILVMHDLGNVILGTKEDFMVVKLHSTCTSCNEAILSGSRWFCKQCKDLHLCSKCVDSNCEFKKKTHTAENKEKHKLVEEMVADNIIPSSNEDNDAVIKNDFIESRDAFLSFCQINFYQFDSLRRAKFSSMMILYEIQKNAELTFGRTSRDLT